jgi:hypothetical protein
MAQNYVLTTIVSPLLERSISVSVHLLMSGGVGPMICWRNWIGRPRVVRRSRELLADEFVSLALIAINRFLLILWRHFLYALSH